MKLFFHLWDERRRIASFGVIGVTALGIHLVGYALLSRVLWPSGNHTVEYLIAAIFSGTFNFEANTRFTFTAAKRSVDEVFRFVCVIIVGVCLNSMLFFIGHVLFHLYDLMLVVTNAFLVAGFTFFSHKFFTFHPEPWRHLKKLKEQS